MREEGVVGTVVGLLEGRDGHGCEVVERVGI